MKDYPDRMTAEEARKFGEDVLNIVAQIPHGQVTTYGDIAALAGWPSHARMVGRTLRYTPGAEKLPCYRVVNKDGRTAPGWTSKVTAMWICSGTFGSPRVSGQRNTETGTCPRVSSAGLLAPDRGGG